MAAPKKRTSKTKKNLRKSNWKAQASIEAKKALATAKRVLQSLENESNINTNSES